MARSKKSRSRTRIGPASARMTFPGFKLSRTSPLQAALYRNTRRAWITPDDPPADTDWMDAYRQEGLEPAIVLDFVGDQYYDGSSNAAVLTDLVSGTAIRDSDGLSLDQTDIAGTGALQTALESPERTVIFEITGGTDGEFMAVLSRDTISELIITNGRELQSYTPDTLVTSVAGYEPYLPSKINFLAAATNALGRCLAMGQAPPASDSSSVPSSGGSQIGYFPPSDYVHGGKLRRMIVYTQRLSDNRIRSVNWPAPGLYPFKGTGAVLFGQENYPTFQLIDCGDILHREWNEPWSTICAVNRRVGAIGQDLIHCNVVGATGPFTGWEFGVEQSGELYVRIMAASDAETFGMIWVRGSTVLHENPGWKVTGASYDGSGLASGVKLYVNGVPETLTVLLDDLQEGSIVPGTGNFLIGSQEDWSTGNFNGAIDAFTHHNIERSPAYFAAHATVDSMPTVDADVVVAYDFDELDGDVILDTSGNDYHGTLADVASRLLRDPVATPEFSLPADVYETTQSLEITCDDTDADIYYTVDGSDPTDASTPYTGAISVAATTTVKAIAIRDLYPPSMAASVVITIGVASWNPVATATLAQNFGSAGGRAVRVRVPASAISHSGTKIRLRFQGPTTGGIHFVCDEVYVGHAAASGNGWDFDGGQVEVKFGGASGFDAYNTNPVSDDTVFALDETKDLIVAYKLHAGLSSDMSDTVGAGWHYYFNDSGTGEAHTTAPSGYGDASGWGGGFNQIEAFYV